MCGCGHCFAALWNTGCSVVVQWLHTVTGPPAMPMWSLAPFFAYLNLSSAVPGSKERALDSSLLMVFLPAACFLGGDISRDSSLIQSLEHVVL